MRKMQEGDFFVFERKNEVGTMGMRRQILELDGEVGKSSVGKGEGSGGKKRRGVGKWERQHEEG